MNHNGESVTLYWSEVELGDAKLLVAETERGLCYTGAFGGSFDDMAGEMASRLKPAVAEWIRDDERLSRYGKELAEYGTGANAGFLGRLDLRGTPFQLQVWRALLDIPHGSTCSYSDIAAAIGKPAAVRAVGSAIGANPVLIRVPCHRVVGKNGALAGYRGGLEMKRKLLLLEREAAWQ
jgi:methylated-DNA-[protein]-cysteine S-methyltransferase